MKKGVFESELAKIVDISKKFGAEKVLLFGSCIEDVRTAHDIDIGIYLNLLQSTLNQRFIHISSNKK